MDFSRIVSPGKLFSEVLEIISEAVVVIDSGERVVFASRKAARMFRSSVEELRSMRITDLFTPEDRLVMVRNILDITRESGEFEGESMFLRPDGTRFLGLLSSSYITWERERGMVMTIHDVTQMKELQRMLRNSERIAFLGHMLDDISHQIRNPVAVIGGYARRLSREGADHRAWTEAIAAEASRLELLLDRLSTFVKIPRPSLRPVPFGEIVDAVRTLLERLAAGSPVRWETRCPDGILAETVALDLPLLLQALEALFLNACESWGEKSPPGIVLFEIRRTEDARWPYELMVADDGEGIAAAEFPHVRDHFFTTRAGHIGLGLSIASRIVEDQQGRIEISSTPGEGTRVSLFLVRERRRPIRTTVLEGAEP